MELNYFQLRSNGNYLMLVLVQAIFQSFYRLHLKVWRSELMNYWKKYNPSSINSKNNVTNIITAQFKSNMENVYEDHQLILINANRKLNFYSSFKKKIRKTEFLNLINSPQSKIAINKFRLSNHKLQGRIQDFF